jgi:TonB-linked SusC/RagA family outer membrane protein
MVNSGLKRTLGSFRFDNRINEKLRVGINVRYSQQEIDGSGTSSATGATSVTGTTVVTGNNTLKNAVRFQPYNGLINVETYDPTAIYDNTINLSNPLAAAMNAVKYNFANVLFTSGTLTYTIMPRLTFNSILGYTVTDKKINTFQGLTTTLVASASSAATYANMPFITLSTGGAKSITNSNTINYRPLASPSKTLDFLLGEETVSNNNNAYDQSIKYFPSNVSADYAFASVQQANPPSGAIQAAPTSIVTGDRLLSFFGRAMYSYLGKYNFNVSVRRDGSSRFSSANRWGTFPSAQFSWKMSEEDFIQNLHLKWLGYLKLRTSYGHAGNNRINDNNLFSTTFASSATAAAYATTDASNTPGLFSAYLANPNLKWETIVSRNLGLDVELFGGRLSASIDGYINQTNDLLLYANVPQQTGYIQQYQNVGQTQNAGVELQLSGTVVRSKGFGYTASFNISTNKNKILELQGGVQSYTVTSGWGATGDDYLVQVGSPVGQFYGYVADGFYTLNDFDRSRSSLTDPTHATWALKPGVADASAILGQRVMPGVLKLKKLGDKTDSTIRLTDRTVLGNNQPLFYGGFNNQFTYKGFDLNIFINFSYGSKTYNANSIEYGSAYKAVGNNMLAKYANRWKTFDANGNFMTNWDQIAAANVNAKTYAPTRGNYLLTSNAIEDGSILRITNISFGYSLPRKLLDRSVFSSFRVYATVNNLYTLTKYTGFDPEASTRNVNPLTPGVDYSAYPRSRTVLVGLNIGF